MRIFIPFILAFIKGLQVDFILAFPRIRANKRVIFSVIVFSSLLIFRGIDSYGIYGTLKLLLPLSIFFVLSEKSLFVLFVINLIINCIQFITGDNQFWSLYSQFFNWGNTVGVGDGVGVRDGLIGLFANRSYNAVLLLLSILFFAKRKRIFISAFAFVILLFTNNFMSLLVVLVWIAQIIYKKQKVIFVTISITFLLLLFSYYNYYRVFINLESRSVIQRMDSFDLFMSYDSIYNLFFGSKLIFERAVDSQLLLLLIRHGIFATIFYYTILLGKVKFFLLRSLILLYSITFPITYNPLMFLVIYSIDNVLPSFKKI